MENKSNSINGLVTKKVTKILYNIVNFGFIGDIKVSNTYRARFQREFLGSSVAIGFEVQKEILYLTEADDTIYLVGRSAVLSKFKNDTDVYDIVDTIAEEVNKLSKYYGSDYKLY